MFIERSYTMRALSWLRLTLNSIVLRIITLPRPLLLSGADASLSLCRLVAADGVERVLIVTDKPIVELGLLDAMRAELEGQGVAVSVFDAVEPDPPVAVIEAGLARMQETDAQAVIAVGGGSPIDCAKIILLSHANKVHPSKLVGIWLYALPRRRGLPFYAVPTTAGTGSEVTIAAVLSDPQMQTKAAVIDPKIVPDVAALDPKLTMGLPSAITAATGMDALTHAVEAYLSTMAVKETDMLARRAVRLITDNLPAVHKDGADGVARENMLLASHLAGMAFTRAGVGYVHAIAHQIGALYHVPHGLANAIILPHVLEFSKPACADRMADLADWSGVGANRAGDHAKADAFIDHVRAQNAAMGIPETIAQLQRSDFGTIIDRAFKEAHGTYGVPRYLTRNDAEALLGALMPAD